MELERVLRGAVRAVGCELADWEISNHGRMLRVFIEKEREECPVTLNDCESASRQLQRVLEVEGLDYGRLEVSSPGLDRRLKTAREFERFAGREADVTLRTLVEGRRHVVGVVRSVEGDRVELQTGSGPFSFRLDDLKRARLVPKL
ncbi:MAG: ribosome maturation factor RimP [Burkholderiales bacterium]|nr:ribosome maturation factor RimP [Burkholderiales bacterium]